MSQLLHFLTDLASDPQKQLAYEKSPEAFINAARLSEAEQIFLKSEDKAQVVASFNGDILQIVCMEPMPDPFPDPDPSPPPDSEKHSSDSLS